jgi:molybdenum cofactor synthesis domain-containing protein
MDVEILAIGDELLLGLTRDANAHWLSQQITNAGGSVRRITIVGDDEQEISLVIKDSIARKPDWLIISGGLGPTHDDKTVQGVADAFGKLVVVDSVAIEMLKKSYARLSTNLELNQFRLKMAKIPEGSIPIQNPVGSAPSILMETASGTNIACLPGVPKEMEAVFLESILPRLANTIGEYYVLHTNYETTGVTEAMLAPILSEIIHSNPTQSIYLKSHPREFVASSGYENEPRLLIQIVSKGKDKPEVEQRLNDISKMIRLQVSKLNGRIV